MSSKKRKGQETVTSNDTLQSIDTMDLSKYEQFSEMDQSMIQAERNRLSIKYHDLVNAGFNFDRILGEFQRFKTTSPRNLTEDRFITGYNTIVKPNIDPDHLNQLAVLTLYGSGTYEVLPTVNGKSFKIGADESLLLFWCTLAMLEIKDIKEDAFITAAEIIYPIIKPYAQAYVASVTVSDTPDSNEVAIAKLQSNETETVAFWYSEVYERGFEFGAVTGKFIREHSIEIVLISPFFKKMIAKYPIAFACNHPGVVIAGLVVLTTVVLVGVNTSQNWKNALTSLSGFVAGVATEVAEGMVE